MSEKWTLQLEFFSTYGNRHCMAIEIDEHTARSFNHIEPLPTDEIGKMLSDHTFDTAIKVLKTKQFRKDLFMDECRRLGAKLAEYMEDKEGWHGVDRQERIAKAESKQTN